MKLLELCTSRGVGGLELYALRCASRLSAAGLDVLAVLRADSFLHRRAQEQGIAHATLPRRSRHLPLIAARRLARLIERHSIDVIHMHWGEDLLLAALAKRWARRPLRLIYTRQMELTRAKKDAYHRFLYHPIDRYLTITDRLLAQAQTYLPLPAARMQRLYLGAPAPDAAPDDAARRALRRRLNIPDGHFAVGLIGRMEENKGQHLLIEAVRQLRAQGTAIHATLIGPVMDAGYAQRLQQTIARHELGAALTLHGAHPAPMAIMPAFDAVALTTRAETFGLVLIEAMRCGVAVIGSNAGGVPEIIEHEHSGLLFQSGDAAQLAAQLQRLSAAPDFCRQLATSGKLRADRLFDETNHFRQLADILQNH